MTVLVILRDGSRYKLRNVAFYETYEGTPALVIHFLKKSDGDMLINWDNVALVCDCDCLDDATLYGGVQGENNIPV